MTNPAQDDDLEARFAAIPGETANDKAESPPEPQAETPPAAEEAAAPVDPHVEVPPTGPEHAETPVFALMVAPAEEAVPAPPPAEEPVLVLPPPVEPVATEVVAADAVTEHPAEPAVIDLSPVAQAMAALDMPRAVSAETPSHESSAAHGDEAPLHQDPFASEAKAEPVLVPVEAVAVPVAPAAAVSAVAVAPRAPAAGFVARTVALMSLLLPYSLVALVLRLVVARLFFLHGQAKIEGPSYLISSQDLVVWPGFHWVVTLPMTVKDQTYAAFAQMAHLPIPSIIAAPVVSYAEFILPICLVLGFATRFAALAFLIMTAVIAVFVAPETWWTTQVYWASILLLLMSLGPGVVSIDAIIRHFHRK